MLRKLLKSLLICIIALFVLGATGWSAIFLWLSPLPVGESLRAALAIIFILAVVGSFVLLKNRKRTLAGFLVVFAALVTWYYLIPPSNDRIWSPEVARTPSATINGNLVTIKNIRNFDYRSATDFTPNWYDKTFDLDKLESTDLMCVYWGSPAIAHIIVSFGFGGNDYVAFSIEMRPELGEENSMVKSFFRQYELIYVVGDERDLVRVRSNYRQPNETVHIYRTRQPPELRRKLFLSYIEKVNELAANPQWYNTLRDNCTTGVLDRTRAYRSPIRFNWKVLLSGYIGRFAYEGGALDTSMPFPELEKLSLINAKAEAADKAEDFSTRIREGLPTPAPMTIEEFNAKSR